MNGGTYQSVCQDAYASWRSGKRFGSYWSRNFLNTAEGIENQFHAARYAQFVENPKQVVPYRVFAQLQSGDKITVCRTFAAS